MAISSRLSCRSSMSVSLGICASILAWKIISALIGALLTWLSMSTTLIRRSARAWDTSFTMPRRSGPITVRVISLQSPWLTAAPVGVTRTLRPLDDETILGSVAKTRRAVVVDEGWRSLSLSAEISARIMDQAFWSLDAPVERVCTAEVPIPYPEHLEQAALPQVPAIVGAAKKTLAR